MARRGFLARIVPVRRPGHPDQGLPDPEAPTDPDYGVEDPVHPEHPDIEPPVGVWPPIPGRPDLPITLPPPVVRPPIAHPPVVWPPKVDNTLPSPPPGIWPPPGAPDNSLPPTPGNLPVFPGTPAKPGTVWPPLPVKPDQGLPSGEKNYLVICWIPGVGYRWVVVDLSLTVTQPIAPHPEPK
jgi:hypothetical protein